MSILGLAFKFHPWEKRGKKSNESLSRTQKTKYLTVLGTKEAPGECQKAPEPP